VYESLVVRILQGIADLVNDLQRQGGSEFTGFEEFPRFLSIDILNREVAEPVGLAEIVHGDDVRVIELREGAGLAGKARDEIRRERIDGRQDLQRDDAVQLGVARPPDGAERADPHSEPGLARFI